MEFNFPSESRKTFPFHSSSNPSLEKKRKYDQVSTELTLSFGYDFSNKSRKLATTLLYDDYDDRTRNLLDGSCLYLEIKKEPEEEEDNGVSTELTLSLPTKIISKPPQKIITDDEKMSPTVSSQLTLFGESLVINAEPISVFISADLEEDVWKIKKKLTRSDLGDMSRFLVPSGLVNQHILPYLEKEQVSEIMETELGIEVRVWDCDTLTEHNLVFKKWKSSKGYVFVNGWVPKFVKRRNLKAGDTVGLYWDLSNLRFNFSLLQKV